MLPGGQPALSQAKYIYVYRNPKDAVVSGYYHTKGLLSKEATWDSYLDQFLTERVVFGPILDHVLGWWKHRGVLKNKKGPLISFPQSSCIALTSQLLCTPLIVILSLFFGLRC